MIASGNEILAYIPQRFPIVMVSELYRADEKSADTGLFIEPENIFVEKDLFREPGIVEHIAQSAALHAGYGFTLAGKAIPIGFIAAVKDLKIFYLPKSNKKLSTHIEIVNQLLGITIAMSEVKCEEKTVATCEMKIYIKG